MKAYSIGVSEFDYPYDMKRILDYLNSHGELRISPEEVERAYQKYSVDVWCAGWMTVDDYTLWEFAHWLSKQEY